MFEAIRKLLDLHRLRVASDKALSAWHDEGIFTTRTQDRCHMCNEHVVDIRRSYERVSLSGERFKFSDHVAFACRRCQTVGSDPNLGSFNNIHVSSWQPCPRRK